MVWKSTILSLSLATAVAMVSQPASAQKPETTAPPRSTCIAVADNQPLIKKAAFDLATLDRFSTRITYVAHSSFRIENAAGFAGVTDFAGLAGDGKVPDVVTMNRAHSTHYTNNPDPAIGTVLRGWGEDGNPAKHNVKIGDVIIRNVTTDIRSHWTGSIPNGNSIFVFEIGGLCIAHLGHLHQLLTDNHYAALGRVDVLMVPIDGGYTMNVDDMAKVVKALNARMIIPMHWFSTFSLQNFLTAMEGAYPVRQVGGSTLTVSLNDLPREPTITVLMPQGSFSIGD